MHADIIGSTGQVGCAAWTAPSTAASVMESALGCTSGPVMCHTSPSGRGDSDAPRGLMQCLAHVYHGRPVPGFVYPPGAAPALLREAWPRCTIEGWRQGCRGSRVRMQAERTGAGKLTTGVHSASHLAPAPKDRPSSGQQWEKQHPLSLPLRAPAGEPRIDR